MAYKLEQHTSTIGAVVSDAVSILTSLGEECREIVDNASEGLQQTQRIQTMDETAGQLESLSEPDVPEALADVAVSYGEYVNKRKGRGCSRAMQCSNAVSMLQAVVDVLGGEEYADNDEAEQLVTEVQEIIDTAEGCEFPGMYG